MDNFKWRHITSWMYQLIIWTLFALNLHDTQAGLKVFSAETAKKLFQASTVNGYAFDIDVLCHAHWMRCRIAEIPIRQQFKGDRDAFVIELAKTGMTLKKFRDLRQKMMIVSVMRNKQVGQLPPPTPREVEEAYQKNIELYRDKDMLKISTITLPRYASASTPENQKKLAEEIRSKIIAGADFATMAKTYSEDSRKEDGGAWDWMERKAMKKSIADAAFALKDGGVSKVIEDEAAYIIIALEAKKLGTATPLDKVRPELERIINGERSKVLVEKWLENLRKKAVIRRM